MAVYRVVAKIGLAARKPCGKRRLAVITHLVERLVPVNELGLFGPEAIPVFNGTTMKVCIRSHCAGLRYLVVGGGKTEFIIMGKQLAAS